MNRRGFLKGLGAAVATLAITTKLATSRLELVNPMLDDGFSTDVLRYKATERFSYDWTDVRVYGSSGL